MKLGFFKIDYYRPMTPWMADYIMIAEPFRNIFSDILPKKLEHYEVIEPFGEKKNDLNPYVRVTAIFNPEPMQNILPLTINAHCRKPSEFKAINR